MPPAPSTKAARPSSIYANMTTSSNRKRTSMSISPSSASSNGISKRQAPSPHKPSHGMAPRPSSSGLGVPNTMFAPVTRLSLPKANRLLFEDEYCDEVVEYMHDVESKTLASAELMDMQPELQWSMRPFLIDFLVEIHQQFHLRPEVLYLALNIVDRYVSKRVVYKKHYQLVGCAALWIAAKFEDAKDRVPTVRELAEMCCKAYDEAGFIQMEGHVLQTIGWNIGHPTAEAWMRLACMGNLKEDTKTQHVARFLMEITLFHREFVGVKPSIIAAGSLMLARAITGMHRHPKHPDEEAVVRVARCLDVCFGDHLQEISSIVVDKYAPVYYSCASMVVNDWYTTGRRFVYVPHPPVTPISSAGLTAPGLVSSWSSGRRGTASSDGSSSSPNGPYSCASSDAGDDTPRTPVTAIRPHASVPDPFSMVSSDSMKENLPPQSFLVHNHHAHAHAQPQTASVAFSSFQSKKAVVAVPQPAYATLPGRPPLHTVQQTSSHAMPHTLRRLSG